eukprot:scaffold2767_cov177-Amphora_coffeaeformis.AAC.4
MAWYEAQARGQALVELTFQTAHELSDLLEVPAGREIWNAGSNAWRDGYQAMKSIFHFSVLVGRPFVLGIGWFFFTTGRLIWQHIIVGVIYKHGGAQAREAAIAFWKFQTGLSRKGLMIEATICALLVALYFFRRWLHRNRYIQRARDAVGRQMERTSQAYRSAVNRIATVSLGLAAMTPHAMFGACVVGLSLFLPGVVAMLAHPGVISMLSWWYPIICTITLLHEHSMEKEEADAGKSNKENDGPAGSPKPAPKKTDTKRGKLQTRQPLAEKGRKRTSGIPPPSPPYKERKKKRQSVGAAISVVSSVEKSLGEELDYWLRFWMVRGALLSIKALFGYFIPKPIVDISRNMECFFYLWIYALPFMVPQTIAGQQLPEARPLRVMTSYISPAARYVHEHIANIVPETFWQNTIVTMVSNALRLSVMLGVFTQDMSNWLLHVLEEGRPLLIPSGTMLMPGIITQYGALYVQFVPMISKSTEGEDSEIYLKFWVLNAMLSAFLQNFASILWWIPFSSHAIFLLWFYLSLPQSIDTWYGVLHDELCSFGLLPGSQKAHDLTQTRVGKVSMSLLEALPKAKDDTSDGEADSLVAAGEKELVKDSNGAEDASRDDVDEPSSDKNDMGAAKAKGKIRPNSKNDDDEYVPPVETATEATTSTRRSTRTRRRRV